MICLSPPQPGYGECDSRPMYYFDIISLSCKKFTVLECRGVNQNRFETLKECETKCIGSGKIFINIHEILQRISKTCMHASSADSVDP